MAISFGDSGAHLSKRVALKEGFVDLRRRKIDFGLLAGFCSCVYFVREQFRNGLGFHRGTTTKKPSLFVLETLPSTEVYN